MPVKFYVELPKYPDQARISKIQGMVIIKITLNNDFSILSSSVLRSVSKQCDAAAMEYALEFAQLIIKYEKEKIVDNELNIPVNFSLY